MADEGARLKKLLQVLDMATTKTLKEFKEENAINCFPGISEQQRRLLAASFSQVKDLIKTNLENEFDLIVKETNVMAALNELDTIVSNSEAEQPEVPDGFKEPFDVESMIRYEVWPARQILKEKLQQRLSKPMGDGEQEEKEIRQLEEELQKKKEMLTAQHATLSQKLGNIEKAASTVEAFLHDNKAILRSSVSLQ